MSSTRIAWKVRLGVAAARARDAANRSDWASPERDTPAGRARRGTTAAPAVVPPMTCSALRRLISLGSGSPN
jgi:hypothetical protein